MGRRGEPGKAGELGGDQAGGFQRQHHAQAPGSGFTGHMSSGTLSLQEVFR